MDSPIKSKSTREKFHLIVQTKDTKIAGYVHEETLREQKTLIELLEKI